MARIRLAWAFFRAFLSQSESWLDVQSGRLLPKMAGAEEADTDDGGSEDDESKPDAEEGDNAPQGDDKGSQKTPEELREELRKGDRVRKRESAKANKLIADLQKQLKDREDADKSEQERAIEKAREEAKAEALSEADKERRSDRLEVAVTRQAARTFADTDDALLHIQRRIAAGDIDADELFNEDGKVQAEPLKKALGELLEDKPHLAADDGRPRGSADGGRGSGGTSLEDMSVEDHLKAIRRH